MECGKCSSRQAAMRRSSSVLFVSLKGYHLCYGRLRFCQCSGLIENDRIRFRHSLQEFTALYGDLVLVCLADCRENGNRHGKF